MDGDLATVLDVLVSVSVLLGGLAAAYRFQVLDFGHRYRSEVWCSSRPAGPETPGRRLFVGNYVIHNTGSRPLKVVRVGISLIVPVEEDGVLGAEGGRVLVHHWHTTDRGDSWFRIGAGERSIFPIRAYVEADDGPLMMRCTFDWTHGGSPSEFVWLFDPALPATWRSDPGADPPASPAPSAP